MQVPKGYILIREEEWLKTKQQVIDLQQMVYHLQELVEHLQKQINKNSTNSHKPPSSDAFRKPIQNNRVQSDKNPGAQPGHKGSTLKMVDNPDRIILHNVEGSCICGRNLAKQPVIDIQKRQVKDLVKILLEVEEHHNEIRLCQCGRIHYGETPNITPVKYGPAIKALSVYLNTYQLIPLNRIQELFNDCFGINISDGAIQNANETSFNNLAQTEQQIKKQLKRAKVIHNDESGLRCEESLMWVHNCSNKAFTHYKMHEKRGVEAINDIDILPGYKGTSVHDRFTSYDNYHACTHSLCNAHLLRDLKGIAEDGKSWASQMIALLLKAKDLKETSKPSGKIKSALLAEYDEIVHSGLAVEPVPVQDHIQKRGRKRKTPSLRLLETFTNRKQQIMEFFVNPNVPFDNNLAERDLRMVKLKQKISGCFRTKNGADIFLRIRSYISTIKKQDYKVLDSLRLAIEGTPVNFS